MDRAEKQHAWVVHPYSAFRKWWLTIILFVTFISVIIIPMTLSFFTEEYYYSTPWITINVLIDTVFVADIVFNFLTGTTDDTETVDLEKIRYRYFKTWFFPDLLAAVPVDYCLLIVDYFSQLDLSVAEFAGVRVIRLIKLIRLFGLLRLLRFSKLLRYTRNWEEMAGIGGIANAIKLIHMFIGIALVCHWNACFQFLVEKLMDFPENSWVMLDGLLDEPLTYQYTKSMFRALCQMMTLNYGSKNFPTGSPELGVITTSMAVGTVMYAVILAKIDVLVTNLKTSESVYSSKYCEVKEYARNRRLPAALRRKIIRRLQKRYRGKWFDEDCLLDELPEPLKREVIFYTCYDLVSNTSMFQKMDPFLISELLEVLVFEMYDEGDLIIRRGEPRESMYFISRGTVRVNMDMSSKILSDGASFGELGLVNDGSESDVTVTALTRCRLYSLSCRDYSEVLKRVPAPVLEARRDTVAIEILQESTDEVDVPSHPVTAGKSSDVAPTGTE